MKKQREDEKRKKEKNAKKEQENKEQAIKVLAQKRREEEEQMNKLEGRMLIMLKNLQGQNTPKEYTLAGLNLGPARCRIYA
jgi:hypothetical protein